MSALPTICPDCAEERLILPDRSAEAKRCERHEQIQAALAALTFDALRAANVRRCETAFHPLTAWSPTDWATAFAGEAGGACNQVKKLRRLTTEGSGFVRPEDGDARQIVRNIAAELADTVIHADLLAARLGIDLGEAVRLKFNEVSVRVGSAVRLPGSGCEDEAHGWEEIELAEVAEEGPPQFRDHNTDVARRGPEDR